MLLEDLTERDELELDEKGKESGQYYHISAQNV